MDMVDTLFHLGFDYAVVCLRSSVQVQSRSKFANLWMRYVWQRNCSFFSIATFGQHCPLHRYSSEWIKFCSHRRYFGWACSWFPSPPYWWMSLWKCKLVAFILLKSFRLIPLSHYHNLDLKWFWTQNKKKRIWGRMELRKNQSGIIFFGF